MGNKGRLASAGMLAVVSGVPMAASAQECETTSIAAYAAVEGDVPPLQKIEIGLRVLVDVIERSAIIFRGRLLMREQWSAANTHWVLLREDYNAVEVLKGALPGAASAGQVRVLRTLRCEDGCDRALARLPQPSDKRVIVLARPASAAPKQADASARPEGPADAWIGPCDGTPERAEAIPDLLGAPDEMARLKRRYPRLIRE